MEHGALFAELVRDLFEVLLDGPETTLEGRVLGVHAALGGVMAAASALPVLPGAPGGTSSPFDECDWPGFGSYEQYWSVGGLAEPGTPVPVGMSEVLRFVASELWRGLESWDAGEPERAVGAWGAGFETSWGPAVAELLLALHPRVAAYRADARVRTRARKREVHAVGLAPDRPATGRPVLGVRFEPCDGGVRVLDVHPSGPAAGRLRPGDVVLAVDGRSLGDVDPSGAGALLAGVIGVERRLEVLRGDGTAVVRVAAVDASDLA